MTDYHGESSKKYRPQSVAEAQMSLPFNVALGILKNGEIHLEDYNPENYNDKNILELASKVSASADEDLDRATFRPMSMPTIASITTKNGNVFRKRIDFQKGDPRNPFTRDEHIGKYTRNLKGKINDAKALALRDEILNIENVDTISKLTAYFVHSE
jgi:2-methylcitrate dehydratase PrpD